MSVQHFRTAPDRVGQCATSLSDGPCDGGTPVPPALSSLALILLAMLLTACSGGSSAGTSPAVPADAAVRAEIEAAPVPAGVDNAVFEDLRGELLRVLCGRSALRAPLGSSNEIHDLLLSGSDSEGWLLSWSYLSCGDYDLNSEVNIADLTPIGLHYQHRFGDPGWLQSCRADGDGNGEVNIADVTPIGVNYGTTVAGYRIYGSQGEAGPWELVGELELPAVQLTERLQYELQTREHAWYQVRPFDRTDNEGLAGDCLLNCGPAVLQHSGTTASETIIIGPGGGSVNGPDRGFGPLSVSIPDGALESAMEISVGSVSGSVQLNGEDLGGDLYYISSAEAVNLALPITVRAWFDPQDRLAVQPLLARLDGQMVPLNVTAADYAAGWLEFELHALYPGSGVHSVSASSGWQPSGSYQCIMWLVMENFDDRFNNERVRYSTGFNPREDGFNVPPNFAWMDLESLGRLAFTAWYFNSYRESLGPLGSRFPDPRVQQKIIARATTSYLLGNNWSLSDADRDDQRAFEELKLAMRRSGGPVLCLLKPAAGPSTLCLAYAYSGNTVMMLDPANPQATRNYYFGTDKQHLRLMGDGSIPMLEDFENILLDATAEPPFGGYEAASVNIDGYSAGQRVEEEQVTLSGHVDSSYYLVDELYFWNTRLPGREMVGGKLPVSGDFSLTVPLREGANEFVVLARSLQYHPYTHREVHIWVANNLEEPGTFWLLQGEEPLPEGQLRFTVEWEGRFESNMVPRSYEYKPYMAMTTDQGTTWVSRNSPGSLAGEPYALWEDRTQCNGDDESHTGSIVVTVAVVHPGVYHIMMDAPVLSMNVIRVTQITIAGPAGGTYAMEGGLAGANQSWHGLTFNTDGNTVTVQDEAYNRGDF